jgi:hypothetical protein
MKPQEVVQRWPKWGAAWAAGVIVKVKAATIATAAMIRLISSTVLSLLPFLVPWDIGMTSQLT